MKEKTMVVAPRSKPRDVFHRLELELLDQYVCEKRGYNPYNTSSGRAPDIWSTKRKRA